MGDITNVNQLKVNPVLTAGFIAKADGVGLPTNSVLYESSSKIGISNTAPDAKLDIKIALDNSIQALKITQTDTGDVGTIQSAPSTSGKYGGLKITGKSHDYDSGENLHTPLTLEGEFKSTNTYTPAVIVSGKVSTGLIPDDERIAGFYNNGTDVGPFVYGNGDFGSSPEINIADSCTMVGWSSIPTKYVLIKRIGKTIILRVYLFGTSDSNVVVLTLPEEYTNNTDSQPWYIPCVIETTTYNILFVNNQFSIGNAGIPASGNKSFWLHHTYTIA
jgi:hypothetical protein